VFETVTAVLSRPTTSVQDAADLVRNEWGIAGALTPLPSERDRNFAVAVDGRPRYVLKVSNTTEDPAFLDLQHRAMARLAATGVPCQAVVATVDGRELVGLGRDGRPPLARMLTWLPGVPLATVPAAARPPELLRDLGRVMGRTAAALAALDHPAAHRVFQWDVLRSDAVIGAHLGAVADASRRDSLARAASRFSDRIAPALPWLRRGIIHNDANDHNLLVDPAGARVTGLLDFGDMVHSPTVNEAAVACAYAMLESADALAVAALVTAGFEEACPLSEEERSVLPDLIVLRLGASVALSAHQARLDPADAYLTISERPAWDLLDRMLAIEPAEFARRLASPDP